MTWDTQALRQLFAQWAQVMMSNKPMLTELDSVVGDGDLGLTMSDGFAAAYACAQHSNERDLGRFFYLTGKAMAAAVPSTMGTLMASGLMQAGRVFKARETMAPEEAGTFFQAWYDGVQQRGKAQPGEKTFLDGMVPALAALNSPADPLTQAREALRQAQQGVLQTTTMVAKHGRAAIHGERSRSFVDPGAMVAQLLIQGYFNFVQVICPREGQ